MVGAVVVRGGKIVGKGCHRFAGGDHAEIVALDRAGAKARGATLYLTLEPCSHYGRTPPCAAAVIRAGIKQVVCGTRDPNPRVAGRGIRQLRRAGIAVRVGILEEECRKLIEAFAKFITRGMPFVTLKLAASLDGRIATANGDSQWISGKDSRLMVHRLRNEVDAVLVGSGTLLADDPQLTCRYPGGRNPWRVIMDSGLRLPLTAKILHHPDSEKTIIAAGSRASVGKKRAVEGLGAKVLLLPVQNGQVAWRPLLKKLATLGIVSVMIEGGSVVAASALRAKIVDKILVFHAPIIVGADGRPMIAALGLRRIKQAVKIKESRFSRSGDDLLMTGYL